MGNNVYSCCTSSNQCDENQGDCDSDDECIGNLQCGKDNCQSPFPSDADCCFSKFTVLYLVLHCKRSSLRLHQIHYVSYLNYKAIKKPLLCSLHMKNKLDLETTNIHFPNFLLECIGSWECNADPKRGICDTINNICVGKLHCLI